MSFLYADERLYNGYYHSQTNCESWMDLPKTNLLFRKDSGPSNHQTKALCSSSQHCF